MKILSQSLLGGKHLKCRAPNESPSPPCTDTAQFSPVYSEATATQPYQSILTPFWFPRLPWLMIPFRRPSTHSHQLLSIPGESPTYMMFHHSFAGRFSGFTGEYVKK